MKVLDTNVVSELMRPEPRASLHTTTVAQAEVLHGVALLPAGRRSDSLAAAAANAVPSENFSGRVLPFDVAAAENHAEITASRRRTGSPTEPFDAQIAAIALTSGAPLATRDAGGFAGCGLDVVDPWQAG